MDGDSNLLIKPVWIDIKSKINMNKEKLNHFHIWVKPYGLKAAGKVIEYKSTDGDISLFYPRNSMPF